MTLTREQKIANLGKYAKKGNIPWNKGMKATDDERIRRFVEAGHKAMTGKEPWNKGKTGYHTSRFGQPQLNRREDNHPLFKDGKAGYRAIHRWIELRLGKPQLCSLCGDDGEHRYHWANKNHEYNLNLKDWIRLCPKCHKSWDKRGGAFL